MSATPTASCGIVDYVQCYAMLHSSTRQHCCAVNRHQQLDYACQQGAHTVPVPQQGFRHSFCKKRSMYQAMMTAQGSSASPVWSTAVAVGNWQHEIAKADVICFNIHVMLSIFGALFITVYMQAYHCRQPQLPPSAQPVSHAQQPVTRARSTGSI